MDAATKSLDHILKSGEYSVIKDVPVFDEHDEFDADGKLLRKFDRKALQKIVDECNRRAKSSGDLSPFGPGHTISGAKEHEQPPTYGYAKDYRVGTFGPDKKLGILVDWYVKKTVTTPDGKEADGITEVKSYPRRSIELWLKDGFIDHIALLRRTPQRDLGLLAFAADHKPITIPSTGQVFSYSKKDFSAAVLSTTGGLKLCYAMEPDMPMDSVPAMATGAPGGSNTFIPGKNGEDDADYEQFCKNCDRYMKEHFGDNLAKYQVAPAADPAGDSAVLPDPTLPAVADKDEVAKMSRQFSSADQKSQVAMFQRMMNYVAAADQRLAAVENNAKQQAQQFSKEDASNRVAMLVGEGFVMDPNEEREDFEKLPLGADRDKKMAKIRQRYQRDTFSAAPPIMGEMLNTGHNRIFDGNGNGKARKYSKEQTDKAVNYAVDHAISFEDAIVKLYPST